VANYEKYFVQLQGNRYVGTADIENDLRLKDEPLSSTQYAIELTNRIKNIYLQKGYARVEVTVEESPPQDNFSRNLTFKITEGSIIQIDKIEFTGKFSRGPEYYADFLQANSGPLVQKGIYNREDFEGGYKKLLVELQNQGFLRAKILTTRARFDEKKPLVVVTINLDEGPLTVIERISFTGNRAFSELQLRDQLDFKINSPLKLKDLETSIRKIKTHYYDSGYMEMQILNENADLVQYSNNNTQALIVFRLDEGPQVHVASIVIEGNTLTQEKIIRKELEFKEGDTLTPALVTESISRLQRLQLFSAVEIRSLEEHTRNSERTIIVRVSETNPGLLRMGMGVTNDRGFTLRGYIGLGYDNILGTARSLSGRVDAKSSPETRWYPELTFNASYVEPYLFDSRTKARLNYTRENVITAYTGRTETSDDFIRVTETNQFGTTLEQNFTSHILLQWNLWSLSTSVDRYLNRPIEEQRTNIATIGPLIQVDYRDNEYYPNRGTLSNFSVDYSAPWLGSTDTVEFVRTNASFSHYLNLGKKNLVWANQVRGGDLRNLSSLPEGGVPYDKVGFFLGGRTTVRGYQPDADPKTSEFFPKLPGIGYFDDTEETRAYRLKTDAQFYLFKSELRIPIPKYENLGFAVFYDGGEVAIHDTVFSDPARERQRVNGIDRYRDSAGVSIHYIIPPLGAVNAEYGCKLDYDADKGDRDRCAAYISIGTF
jgi:outer membrane protein assembly complex protein YaeT